MVDRPPKQNRTSGPSGSAGDADKIGFLQLKDLQTPLTKQYISRDNPAASDDGIRLNCGRSGGNTIQATRTWDVETIQDGSHHTG